MIMGRVAHWGNGDGYRSPHPHPHFSNPSPSLPISPFGENGDGGVLGGGPSIPIPVPVPIPIPHPKMNAKKLQKKLKNTLTPI